MNIIRGVAATIFATMLAGSGIAAGADETLDTSDAMTAAHQWLALVDAGRGPLLVRSRDDLLDDHLDQHPRRRLEDAELGGDETQPGCPRTRLEPWHRGGEEHEAADAVGVAEAEFQCHPAAHAVADHVRGVEFERIEERDHRVGEERRVIAAEQRLVGVAEAR